MSVVALLTAQAASAAGPNSAEAAARSVTILGVRVHACSGADARANIESMLRSGAQHTIVPVNPEMIIAARSHREFRDTINRADLALPDGAGVILAARLQGAEMRERVPGSDTVELLAAIAARDGLRMFFLGAAPGIADEAARRLRERHPGLVIAGTHAGSPAPADEAEICAMIAGARTDILLVAYGAPKQELWVARNLAKLPVRLAMSVGGTFDFLAGVKSRAPRWMQRAGLEWLFRLAQEPRRWRRMLALPKFAFLAFTEQLTRRA